MFKSPEGKPWDAIVERVDHRVKKSLPILASCRDCPSYLASAETVRNLLLPAETVVLGKYLPAETVGGI